MFFTLIGAFITSQSFSQIQQAMSGDTVLWQDFANYNNNAGTIGWKGANDVSPFDSTWAIRITGASDGMWVHRAFGNPASGNTGSAAYNFNAGLNWKDLLVTPKVDLSGGAPQIDFDIMCTSSLNTNPYRLNRLDTLLVIVSDDGATDTTARFRRTGVVCRIDTTTNFSSGPIHYAIDLSAFNTRDSVHIAFYAKDYSPSAGSGYFVYIDNVYIRKTNPGDYAAENFQTFRSYYFHNQTYTTSAVIKNWGTTGQSQIPVILYVDETPVDTEKVTLDPGAQIAASFTWTANVTGEHMLKVKTMLGGDAVPANDSIMRPIKIFPQNWTQYFYDDFSAGTDNWGVDNLSTYLGQVWQLFDVSYPNYQLNEYCFTNVFAANDDIGGSSGGWTYTSATFNSPISTLNLDSLFLEYDYDFVSQQSASDWDSCIIFASIDGGVAWDTVQVHDQTARAGHDVVDLTDFVGYSDFRLKFIYKESGGWHKWWAIDNVILRGYSDGIDVKENVREPNSFTLYHNYPNPFNPTTTISYYLPGSDHVRVTVFNALGQEIRTLVNGKQSRGQQTIQWDGKDNHGVSVSSGVYIYRVQAGSEVKSGKMMFIK